MNEITSKVRRQNEYDISSGWDIVVSCKFSGHKTRDELITMKDEFEIDELYSICSIISNGMFGEIMHMRQHELMDGVECYVDGSKEELQYGVMDTITLHTVIYPSCHFDNSGILKLK